MYINEVYENIYHAIFPLTGNPLKEINIFTIKAGDEALIIDTGFNNEEIRSYMDRMIDELDLDLSKTRLFLTHLHSDHVGLAKYLEDRGIGEILLSEVDGYIVDHGHDKDDVQWITYINNAKFQGLLPDEDLRIEDHPGYKNRPTQTFTYTKVNPGDRLSIGDFDFVMIDEAGHTPGMLGLYDERKKILFCGDHILGKITPNITWWGDKYGDSLGIYLENIKKLKDLDIEHLYSAHRFLVEDVNARIDELIAHHHDRLEDSISIIKKMGRANTTEITQRMNWDIRAKDWKDFPASQKWFAVGEAAAHLKHLLAKNVIKEEVVDGVGYYSMV